MSIRTMMIPVIVNDMRYDILLLFGVVKGLPALGGGGYNKVAGGEASAANNVCGGLGGLEGGKGGKGGLEDIHETALVIFPYVMFSGVDVLLM